MDALLYTIIAIIGICLLLIWYVNIYNHFQSYIIRINEVESMIDNYLRNKYDLINRAIPIIKGNIISN